MSLKKESYEIVLTGRGLRALDRLIGHGNIGRKNRFLAPGDYAPGKDDDTGQGYMPGSRLSNENGDVFMCVHAEEGKANWVQIASMEDATDRSHVNMEDVAEEAPAPVAETVADPKPQNAPKTTGQTKSQETPGAHQQEDGTMAFGVDAGPNRGRTAIPEDMPWSKYVQKNGIKSIEEVQKKVDNGTLAGLKYLNEERAGDIAKWLEDN